MPRGSAAGGVGDGFGGSGEAGVALARRILFGVSPNRTLRARRGIARRRCGHCGDAKVPAARACRFERAVKGVVTIHAVGDDDR